MSADPVIEVRLAIVDETRILDAIAALAATRRPWWQRLAAWARRAPKHFCPICTPPRLHGPRGGVA